jgi:malate dehydrogenase (oxaloacetate-decarboxylating)
LGLGNIGALASIPVMEGKCLLFKEYAGIDAFPLCLDTQDTEEIIETVRRIAPVFGRVNLEDISAPRCFEVEQRLQDLGIPVFHDDQHGTAIVLLAAMLNAAKVINKRPEDLRMVINGAGAAGTAIAKLLRCIEQDPTVCTPVADVIICDSKGAIHAKRTDLNPEKQALLAFTNRNGAAGSLQDEARKGGAAVVGTGRSDFPNQVNNVLAFPGIFRGALDANAARITPEMKLAAAHALANSIKNPTVDRVLPSPLDRSVAPLVAKAVYKAATLET